MCTIVSDTMLNAWTHTNIFNFQKKPIQSCVPDHRTGRVRHKNKQTNKQAPGKVKWGPSPNNLGSVTLHPYSQCPLTLPAHESVDSCCVYYMPGTLLKHLGGINGATVLSHMFVLSESFLFHF